MMGLQYESELKPNSSDVISQWDHMYTQIQVDAGVIQDIL